MPIQNGFPHHLPFGFVQSAPSAARNTAPATTKVYFESFCSVASLTFNCDLS